MKHQIIQPVCNDELEAQAEAERAAWFRMVRKVGQFAAGAAAAAAVLGFGVFLMFVL